MRIEHEEALSLWWKTTTSRWGRQGSSSTQNSLGLEGVHQVSYHTWWYDCLHLPWRQRFRNKNGPSNLGTTPEVGCYCGQPLLTAGHCYITIVSCLFGASCLLNPLLAQVHKMSFIKMRSIQIIIAHDHPRAPPHPHIYLSTRLFDLIYVFCKSFSNVGRR